MDVHAHTCAHKCKHMHAHIQNSEAWGPATKISQNFRIYYAPFTQYAEALLSSFHKMEFSKPFSSRTSTTDRKSKFDSSPTAWALNSASGFPILIGIPESQTALGMAALEVLHQGIGWYPQTDGH